MLFQAGDMATHDVQPGDRARQAERLPLDASTRLRPNDWSSLEVRVVNLSRTGLRAECDARLGIGGCVSLDVPGIGAVEAQVEWQRDDAFGAKFVHPISLERCGWAPQAQRPVLAALLFDRAAAQIAGRHKAERVIRRKILAAAPMGGAARRSGKTY